MNSKIANLLADNLGNKKIVAEMIMYICNKNEDVENRLIDLCLSRDTEFVTKDVLLKHIDKIKPICMKYMSNIIYVDDIKIIYVNNIASEANIQFTATVEAWFKDQQSADEGYAWYYNNKEDAEHKFKGIYKTTCNTYISFKDIDLN